MKSAFAVTFISEDAFAAASELAVAIKKQLVPGANSCGILFAEEAFDLGQLGFELEAQLGFPVVGCSSTAQISHSGYHRLSASLLVLTADDCQFGVALSPLDDFDVAGTFQQLDQALGGQDPEILFLFSTPKKEFMADRLVEELSEASGNKPIFGGLVSDYGSGEHTSIFWKGKAHQDSFLILAVSGNIRPCFFLHNVRPDGMLRSTVTAARASEVMKIDDLSVYEYLEKHGGDPSNAASLAFSPICVELGDGAEIGTKIMARIFFKVDKDTGYGYTQSHIPEGSTISFRMIDASDIAESAQALFKDMAKSFANTKRDEKDYVYSTVFGVSCIARHLVMNFEYEMEGDLARDILPPELNFMAFYSYGEFCPVSTKNNRAENRMHNLSLALCMF